MPVNHREIAFEAAIEHHLFNVGGYGRVEPADFDCDRAIDSSQSKTFVRETQPETWQAPEKLHRADMPSSLLVHADE